MNCLIPSRRLMQCCLAALLTFPMLLASSVLAQGQDFTWIAPGGGTFAESSNWDLGMVPGRFDRSVFDMNAVYMVTLDQDAQNQYALFKSGEVTMDLNGFIFRNYLKESGLSDHRLVVGETDGDDAAFTIADGIWERVGDSIIARDGGSIGQLTITGSGAGLTGFGGGPSTGRIRVGQFGDGSLRVLSGARLEGDLVIGGEENGIGHVVISGPGTEHNGGSIVGYYARGYLEISDGATVTSLYDVMAIGQNTGSYGEVSLSGPDTVYYGPIRAGWGGEGHLTIGSGVTMFQGDIFVADRGSTGTAHISGPDTNLDLGRITVGGGGSGSLVIDGGAQVILNSRTTLAGIDGSILITGSGTYLESRGMNLGEVGFNNNLVVSNGATVVVPNNGTSVDADASLLVTDPGTTFIDRALPTGLTVYGEVANGRGMTIANGATVEAAGLFINGDPGASLELTGEGSSLTVKAISEKHISLARIGDIGIGTLIVGEGATACFENLLLGEGGTIEGEVTVGECGTGLSGFGINAETLNVAGQAVLSDTNIEVFPGGTLTGDGVVLADVVNQGGRIAPGDRYDVLTVLGDFQQQTLAGMTIELRGRYKGEYDHLDVVGVATLDGELVCEIAEGASFATGNQFIPLTATEVHGTFRSARMSRPNGQRVALSYEPDRVVITIAEGLAIDSSELHKNQDATVSVTNSRPNTQTWLIYSTTGLGETRIAPLDVTCGVRHPALAVGPIRTNSQGAATFQVHVPNVNGNPRVWLQAVQIHDASNVLQKTIRN